MSHPILLTKLQKIGIRGIPHSLFESYLSNRTQVVRIGKEIGEERSVEFGVTQGTVLGPVLFSLYMNDITKILKNETVICYADDTVVLTEAENWEIALHNLETALTKIKLWLDQNKLTLNFKKTHYVPFSLQNTAINYNIKLKIHN